MGKFKLINPKLAKAIPIFRDERSEETNLRILETLALHGELSITDIHKKIHEQEVSHWKKKTGGKTTYPGSPKHYTTIDRRVRDLEDQYYVKHREEPSQKRGKERRVTRLTQKGWWVVNLVSNKVRSEWRKAFKNYEKDFEEWFPRGVRLVRMMVESPNTTDNIYQVYLIRPFRDLVVSGHIGLDMIGEYLPDVVYEKSIFDFKDMIERLRKHKSPLSWVKRLTKKELQILDRFFHSPQVIQAMDETVDTFRGEWERTLVGISQEAKKPHKRRSKKLYFG